LTSILPAEVEATAVFRMSLTRQSDGIAACRITADLPGVEPFDRWFVCDLSITDEAFTWANDVHGESKSWRSLMDCVAFDWCEAQQQLL